MKEDIDAMAESSPGPMPPACGWSWAMTTGPSASPTATTARSWPTTATRSGSRPWTSSGGPPSTAPSSWAASHELGTVTEGKLADLVVVDGDPVDDLSLLGDPGNLLAVMQGGRLVRDQLPDRSH